MNIRAYSFAGTTMILAAWLAAAPHLSAQTTFTIPFKAAQSSPTSTFTIDSFGTLSETSPTSTSATFTFASTPQMVWLPALGAFRAGSFSGSQTGVGQYSVAFGGGSASGFYSFAAGSGVASGGFSVAIGAATAASAPFAIAMGNNAFASGSNSFAEGMEATAAGSLVVS